MTEGKKNCTSGKTSYSDRTCDTFSSFVDFSSSNHHFMNFLTLNQQFSYTSVGSSRSPAESQYSKTDFSKAQFP